MRVCIVNEFFYPDNTGGTGTVLSNLARELRDGYETVAVSVLTSRNQYRAQGKPLPATEDWHGISIQRIASPQPGRSTALRLLANFIFSCLVLFRLLRQPRFDVLLVGTAPPTAPLAAWIYKQLTGTPYVYITYDLEPDRVVALGVVGAGSLFVKMLRRLQHGWLHSASKVVVLGRCMRQYVGSHYGLPEAKIATIPIGFDPAQVTPADRHSHFRQEQNLTGFVVLYAGNFGRYHNFNAILDAAKAVQGREITFALIGKGAQRQHILDRIAAEQIANVRVFPFVALEAFSDMLASADVCLVTLEKGMEGLCVPSKLYSNMAAGRPTLALVGPSSEVARVVTESQSGVQIDPGDVATLTQTLIHLADAPDEVARMGRNARRTLEQHYTNSHVAAQYYRVFQEITNSQADERQTVAPWHKDGELLEYAVVVEAPAREEASSAVR